MVKVFVGTDHEYYMDGYLQENMDTAKKVIKEPLKQAISN